ncbi:Calcium-binding mitochondrial carrier protein SCaMC-1-B, partial [Frankliniella fusca]
MAGLGSNSADDGSGHGPILPHGDEERLEALFKTLDKDGNGRIDIMELSNSLKDSGVHHTYAQKFIEHSDANKSGDVCLSEFIEYVREHEKHLRLSFTHIDKNRDGKIDQDELVRAFKDLGVEIDNKEALKLLKSPLRVLVESGGGCRMDKDGSLNISFDEWRDYLMYAPSTNIHDLIKYWRHSTRCPMLAMLVLHECDKDR